MSAAIFALYLAQVFAAISIGYWLLQLSPSVLTGLGVAIVMLFIGTRLRGINNIVHECSHFAFSDRREDNVMFGNICASLLLNSFRSYRDDHMSHHAHLGDYERDAELGQIKSLRLEDPLTPRTVLRHMVTPLLGRHLPYYLSIDLSARDGVIFSWFKIGLIAAALAFLVIDPVPALLLLWLPFLWIFPAINYWTDCIDHSGLVGSDDELDASRNFVLPKALRVILFPRNDCYHLIHHLFPQVPVRHFDACHRELLSNPEYRQRAEQGLNTVPVSGSQRPTMEPA